MPKRNTNMPPELTPSWDLAPVSVKLFRDHFETLLWLVLLPAFLLNIGLFFVNRTYTSFGPITTDVQATHAIHMLTRTGESQLGIGLIVLGVLWLLITMPAAYGFALRAARGKVTGPPEALRASRRYFWRYYGLNILVSIVLFAGFVALIIPGFIFLRRYYLAPYYLIDRKLGILDAMRTSAHEGKPFAGRIWGTIGVMAVFSFAASAFDIIPYVSLLLVPLFTYLYFFGAALRYREISQVSGN